MSTTVRRPYDQVDPRPAILVILQNPSLPGDTFEGMDDLTPNAVIAWNVRRLRRERGWTQAELAERLSERDDKPWTFSMVSDAETAGRADRNRQFTVNEVSVLARVFQVSVIALFVPDPAQLVRIGQGVYTREDYDEFPDLWVAEDGFTNARKLTDVNPGIDDYRLSAGSPDIESGSETRLPASSSTVTRSVARVKRGASLTGLTVTVTVAVAQAALLSQTW